MKRFFSILTVFLATLSLFAGNYDSGESQFTSTSYDCEGFSYSCTQGGGTSNPAIYSGNIRLYRKSSSSEGLGSYMTITPKNGYTLTKVTIIISSNLKFSYKLNGGNATTKTATELTVSDVTSSLVFQNYSKSQMNIKQIIVEYSSSAGCTAITPSLSYPSSVTVGGTLSPTLTGNTGNGTVTYSIASGEGATVNSSTGVLTATVAGSVTVKATIAANGDYCEGTATSGTITISEPTYTVTATSNNESLGTVSVSGKVITATPAACVGYASPAYTVTGTATVSQSGNTFTVTASSNCNVQINFAESVKDTYIDKVHGTDMTGDYCGTYEAPTIADKTQVSASEQTRVCDHDHYHFVGWVATGITGSQENEPDGLIKAGTAMTASGKTYYAVWAQEK